MLTDINLTAATYSKRICSVFRVWFVVLELKDNQIITLLFVIQTYWRLYTEHKYKLVFRIKVFVSAAIIF